MARHHAETTAAVRDIVVIGASAGGLAVLRTIASQLPPGFAAAVLIVLHTGAHPSRLPQILAAWGPNPAQFATDGESLEQGRLVVAVPDRHLVVRDGVLRTVRGAKEHHTRPAIDPLFRSAALWAGPRVIGVLLSGRNDDGTSGLHAIQSCGGVTIVQDPEDADEPIMPAAALRHVAVDHRLPSARIAQTLVGLIGRPVGARPPPPEHLLREHASMFEDDQPLENLAAIGRPTTFACPDCNGTLFELSNDKPKRYRCHTGHAYTLRTLGDAQAEATEVALWSAMRALHEKEIILRKLAELDRTAGDAHHADESDEQAERISEQIGTLRRLIDEP
jgi:two-component system chemotaxis response regulator CheB